MKVIVTINRWDLLRLNLYLFPRAKANWIFVLVVALGAAAYLGASHEGPVTGRDAAIFLGSGLAGALLGLLAGTIVCVMMLMLPSGQRDGVLGEHEYEVREEGLFERTKANEGTTRWSGIRSIARTGSAIYIGLGGYLFYIIPTRAFSGVAALNEYFELLRKHWRPVA